MKLDLFTIIAQVINFLILLWLLKRFLYKPILHAIDEREKRVNDELANADQKKAEAQKESDAFKQKNREFDLKRSELMNKAIEEANSERQKLLDEARKAADILREKRKKALTEEEQELYLAIRHRTQQEVIAIARKTLADLAGTNLEEAVGSLFVRRLQEMPEQTKKTLVETFAKTSHSALIRSAFDLPGELRQAILDTIRQTFSTQVPIQFEIDNELINGIELSMNDQKLSWNINDYLTSLEKNISELFEERNEETNSEE
ncbi:MAG: F0F1 ATP synthase subunit delta [Acidobacteria bacterium]|jgi:F-type H+-transporting ATPase subunit b|nr:F0F1 ATP synthase subunit delta [Acidobacteriota bacterium]